MAYLLQPDVIEADEPDAPTPPAELAERCWVEDWIRPGDPDLPARIERNEGDVEWAELMLTRERWLDARQRWLDEHQVPARHHCAVIPRRRPTRRSTR